MNLFRKMRILGFSCLLFGVVGCLEPAEPAGEPVVAPPPRPALTAARDAQITLFGELPSRHDVPFFSRSATSLLRHSFAEEGADFDPDIEPSGKRLVFASTRHTLRPDLYVKSVEGTAVIQLTADPASDVQPVFSPDGRWVAFASDRTGNWDIWIIRIDGTQPVQVTRGPEDNVHPSWSPDGKQLAFCSLPHNSGQWEIWIANATAGATKKFIGYGLFPEWSPVGNVITYQRARQRGSRWFSIWTVELVSGEPRHPTEVAASADYAMIAPSWHPDGTRLTYGTVTTAPPASSDFASSAEIADIWMVDLDGRSRVRLTDGHSANHGPVWSPDGRIYFTSARSGHENIWSLLPVGEDPGDPGEAEGVISRRDGSETSPRGSEDS